MTDALRVKAQMTKTSPEVAWAWDQLSGSDTEALTKAMRILLPSLTDAIVDQW